MRTIEAMTRRYQLWKQERVLQLTSGTMHLITELERWLNSQWTKHEWCLHHRFDSAVNGGAAHSAIYSSKPLLYSPRKSPDVRGKKIVSLEIPGYIPH